MTYTTPTGISIATTCCDWWTFYDASTQRAATLANDREAAAAVLDGPGHTVPSARQLHTRDEQHGRGHYAPRA